MSFLTCGGGAVIMLTLFVGVMFVAMLMLTVASVKLMVAIKPNTGCT